MRNRVLRTIVDCLLIGTLASSCGDDRKAPEERLPAMATVTGRLLDSDGNPVVAATVSSQNTPASTRTDSSGSFTLAVKAGAERLTAMQGQVVIVEHCLAAAEGVIHDLGDLDPETPTQCDAICTNPPDGDDRDCDGVPDDVERTGWQVLVTLGDGTTETRRVNGDPDLKDTDSDGLNDGQEQAARTDPRRKDTDGDLLSDYAEIVVYKSNPLDVDSDRDARGPSGDRPSDPNLWDGHELAYAGTSPTQHDTDGDGLTDYVEIHSGGTNPRVADLPSLALDLHGDPHIELNESTVQGCDRNSIDLAREEHERVATDNVTTKMSIENTVKLHTEAEAGTSTWPPSFSAKLTTDTEFKHGFVHETSNSFKQTSVQEAQTRFECWERNNVDFANGKISVAMKLSNRSSLTFKVKDIRVIAYQIATGGSFRLIGTLEPDQAWPQGGYVLGPAGELVMTVRKTDIGADVMKALVQNPSALMFDLGGYSLFQVDDMGVNETVNYAKLGESVIQRTGLLVVDYGDGDVERYMVATNVARNPDGSGRGVTLKEVLTGMLGISYATAAQSDEHGTVIGRKVVNRVKTVETYQNDPQRIGRGFWVVSGTSDAFAQGIDTNFDNIVIKNGQRINLTYLKDTDLDGVFDNEEYLLGTDKADRDSDGDGLSDYDESNVGWDVAVRNLRHHVYPDPRFADLDGDYLTDSLEIARGSDPYSKDTDKDGLADTNDPYPLSPPCVSAGLLGLAAWWNGAGQGTAASDVWTVLSTGDPTGHASDGALADEAMRSAIDWWPPYTAHVPGELNSVFMFNPAPTQRDQSIVIEDIPAIDPARSISPQAFTLSAWIFWSGNATGAAWATLLSKGAPATASYALLVGPDGTLRFTLYRSAHDKCYGWLFGWFDDLCADSDAYEQVAWSSSLKVPLNAWVHVTASFSRADEKMRLALADDRGISRDELGTVRNWSGTTTRGSWTTNFVVVTSEPLRIGLDATPDLAQAPFRGMMDEVQVFGRSMTPSEVTLFHDIGVCDP